MSDLELTQVAETYVQRINAGDAAAFDELIRLSRERMEKNTRRLLREYARVRRWEQTDDVVQQATLRMYRAVSEVRFEDARHFFRMMALQIRRELLDLARKHSGPEGMAYHHRTQANPAEQSGPVAPLWEGATLGDDPQAAAQWAEFHRLIETLPEEQRELFDLIYYHELSQEEVAQMLGTSDRTIRRRWREAKLALGALLPDSVFPD